MHSIHLHAAEWQRRHTAEALIISSLKFRLTSLSEKPKRFVSQVYLKHHIKISPSCLHCLNLRPAFFTTLMASDWVWFFFFTKWKLAKQIGHTMVVAYDYNIHIWNFRTKLLEKQRLCLVSPSCFKLSHGGNNTNNKHDYYWYYFGPLAGKKCLFLEYLYPQPASSLFGIFGEPA